MTATQFHIEGEPPRLLARTEGTETALPALWLRERCRDPQHLDARTEQRLFDPHALPDDLELTAARIEDDGAHAWLAFSDGYSGRYELARLAREMDGADGLPEAVHWDATLDRDRLRHHFDRLDEADGLHAAVTDLLRFGFIIVTGVPCESGRILEVARRFGYLRETNFGSSFEVRTQPDSNDLAYRTVALGPHTDNPYREPVPGIQLLHCLVNETTGGLSTLVDSLSVATVLQREDPEGFALLDKTPVRFRFVDKDEELVERRTIIRHNADGRMTGVHYSPRLDDLPLLDTDTTRRFQRARHRLGELFADPRHEIRFPLRAGELMMFDNNRILHGRTSFDSNEGHRHLQGCYIDLDGPRSRYRTLARSTSLEHEPLEA